MRSNIIHEIDSDDDDERHHAKLKYKSKEHHRIQSKHLAKVLEGERIRIILLHRAIKMERGIASKSLL